MHPVDQEGQRARTESAPASLGGKAPDEAALTALYRALRGPLYNYARRLLADADAAEDAVQELFADLWESPPSVLPEPGLLFNRLRSRIADARRSRRREGAMRTRVAEDRWARTEDNVADGAVAGADMLDAVHSIVAALPDERREVLIKARIDGVPHREIAEEMGITTRTVRWHITTAVETIRAKLEREGFNVPRALARGRPKGSRRSITDV